MFFPPLKYWRNTESKNGLPLTLSKYINAWHYFHNNPYGNNNILVTDYYERISSLENVRHKLFLLLLIFFPPRGDLCITGTGSLQWQPSEYTLHERVSFKNTDCPFNQRIRRLTSPIP